MGDKFWGAVLHGGLMIISCQGWGSFRNAFSNNLKTVYNLEFFGNHEGIYTSRESPDQSTELWK